MRGLFTRGTPRKHTYTCTHTHTPRHYLTSGSQSFSHVNRTIVIWALKQELADDDFQIWVHSESNCHCYFFFFCHSDQLSPSQPNEAVAAPTCIHSVQPDPSSWLLETLLLALFFLTINTFKRMYAVFTIQKSFHLSKNKEKHKRLESGPL